MGNLNDFIQYFEDRIRVVSQIEQQLCQLQEKYETFFAEVTGLRESELAQLTEHILVDRGKLPDWFNQSLEKAEAQVEQELAQKLAALEQQHDALLARAEETRQQSREQELKLRGRNVELDEKEEALKARNEKLLSDIAGFNERIRQLGRGFGFFANFFSMRRLNRQRAELDREQGDVTAQIDALRQQWALAEQPHARQEQELCQQWVRDETEAAAVQTKIDYLNEARPRIVLRSTVERVLFELVKEPPAPQSTDPACPRCGTRNPAQNHFCHICAGRLLQDRPDFEGSIHEMAEINLHHSRFSDGMKAGQEIIGLVRGLKSGLEAFLKSVRDVKQSETTYKLATLTLDVPEPSLQWGQQFDALLVQVQQDLSLHPKVFAEQVQRLTREVFTEQPIKDYFEGLGTELSNRAHAQWD